ncbi:MULTISPECIES: GtrA family protein [Corynebacterium]|uniref:GtrA family protein n=1 Tax=Corynebacterium TaxID=1716 RepID=UPI00124D792F|nr:MULTISPECIES: GtrA family protein [Corynebacterium]
MTNHQVAQPRSGSGASRYRRNFRQFLKFGIVGASGVVVNFLTVVVVKKILDGGFGIHEEDAAMNLLDTQFHIRWFHIILTIAFLVANMSNFQLNRMWTFRSSHRPPWLKQFIPFLVAGLGALVVTQVVSTLLINPESPVALPSDIFDGSTGLRTKLYWAALAGTAVAMPVNFVVNKLWTFRKTRVVLEQAPV